jgi:hypothetical protein
MITLFHAIQSLVPGAEVSVGIYDQKIEWHNPLIAPVTLKQVLEEQQRLQSLHDWHEYQRNRAREYPSIQEQLDALYHAGVFPTEMAERIRAVKTKYPRPSFSQPQWVRPLVTIVPEPVLETVDATPPALSEPAPPPPPKMTVEEWFEEEAKITREQWLEQQRTLKEPPKMTREEWLAEQAKIK